jgi:CRISPR-associated endonuclease Csn1
MKNNAEKRAKMSKRINDNEATNLRLKLLLTELKNDQNFENIRPYSPTQLEILKIYEEGVLSSNIEIPDDISKIAKLAQPSLSELTKYKLWLQQKYRSPYTGEIIPLAKLFTSAYEIEHIIPQSRYFDDSLSNKVICEAEVNKDKDNETAFEYIKDNSGKKIELSYGKSVSLFTIDQYTDFVKANYAKNRSKLQKLMMEDIPDEFIQRQLNDSRYISKVINNLMSNIVREENEVETNSKNVISCNGSITSQLKQDWGLNDVWNDIISPRFERMNEITNSNLFGEWTNKDGKRVFQTTVPLEYQKGFSKKRIDHRHHALDAIVVACTTRDHINYLNNESSIGKSSREDKQNRRYDLRAKICKKKYNTSDKSNYRWEFKKPWENFTGNAKDEIETIIVSFKQNLRVINKTTNKQLKYITTESGQLKKQLINQAGKTNWAIRKPLHKDTVSGLVNLKFKKEVSFLKALDTPDMIVDKGLKKKVGEYFNIGKDKKEIVAEFKKAQFIFEEKDFTKVEVYYFDNDFVASRVKLDASFNSDKIESVTDSGIRAILKRHLSNYNEDKAGKVVEHPELAFSDDGIDELNKNIIALNNGKFHQPIYKVRTFETKGNKFNVGHVGNKKDKYVEAAKGTNLFFAIYESEEGVRSYESIPFNVVVQNQIEGLSSVPQFKLNEKTGAKAKLLFVLSPNDLMVISKVSTEANYKRSNQVYKVVSFTGNRLYAVPHTVATSIVDKVEFTQLNKMEQDLDKISIKEKCDKILIDRIGNIVS